MNLKGTPEIDLSQKEISRYQRHLSLPEIGVIGQKRLKASSVLCIGSGGLGSPLLMYLAAIGIGRIGIVDFDIVELSNLQRQIIHSEQSLGSLKTTSARKRIQEINPNCNVEIFDVRLTAENVISIFKTFDIVCDCTDNFPSRYLINDACTILKKPNIYGSIAAFKGQVSVFNLNESSPNLRDLIPEPPPPREIPSCEEGGVIGVLPGIIGIIQATEIIKIITKIGNPLDGRLLVFDALDMSFKELSFVKDLDQKRITNLNDYEQFYSSITKQDQDVERYNIKNITSVELKKLIDKEKNNILIIDVRDKKEHIISSIPFSESIPINEIIHGNAIERIREMKGDKTIYVFCKSGIRSKKALIELKRNGIEGINIEGGIDRWF